VYVVSVVNHKGGVAKTNLVGNLAAEGAALGLRVLAVDLDPQHTLTSWMVGYTPGVKGVAEVLGYGSNDGADPRPFIQRADAFDCDLLPADLDKLESMGEQIKADAGKVFRLADAMVKIAGDYDLVLLDCRPALGSLTQAAVAASQGVIIPINGSESLEGYAELEAFLDRMKRIAPVEIIGTVLTMHRPNTRHFDEIGKGLEAIGGFIPIKIGLSVDASELHARHVPARIHKKNGKSHADYRALAKFLAEKLGLVGAPA
jgi:chromosome partitioning protein